METSHGHEDDSAIVANTILPLYQSSKPVMALTPRYDLPIMLRVVEQDKHEYVLLKFDILLSDTCDTVMKKARCASRIIQVNGLRRLSRFCAPLLTESVVYAVRYSTVLQPLQSIETICAQVSKK